MAKIFTHDCKKCKKETEHTAVLESKNIKVTCKTCGTVDNVPIGVTNGIHKNDSLAEPKQ